MNSAWTFAIDRGGTFTDVVARSAEGRLRVEKLLSEDPRYGDAALEANRDHWLVRETTGMLRRTLARLDVSRLTDQVRKSRAVLEAADGAGMTPSQRLWRVEAPLALPVVMAGIRTAAVWTIGAATLSTPVGQTSLGNYIFAGLQTENWVSVLFGCAASAVLALVVDQLLGLIETGAAKRDRRLACERAAARLPAESKEAWRAELAPRLDRAVDPFWVSRQSLEASREVLKPGCGWLPADWMPEAAMPPVWSRMMMAGLLVRPYWYETGSPASIS